MFGEYWTTLNDQRSSTYLFWLCTGVSQEQTRWTAKWYVLNDWTCILAFFFPACRWASCPKSKIWCQVSNSPCFLEKFSTIVLNWKHFAFILLHRKLLQILGNRKYKKIYKKYIYIYMLYNIYIYTHIYIYTCYTFSTNHMVVFQANYASWLSFLWEPGNLSWQMMRCTGARL